MDIACLDIDMHNANQTDNSLVHNDWVCQSPNFNYNDYHCLLCPARWLRPQNHGFADKLSILVY